MKPSSSRALGVVLFGVLATLAGCQAPQPISGNVQVRLSDEEAYRHFWDHSLQAVRHFGYSLDRVDPAAGVIASEPVTSKQWFEFWRNDTLGGDEILEASLHTIRREVRVEIQPVPADKSQYAINVRVRVERLSRIERQVTTAANAHRAFTEDLPAVQQSENRAEAAPHWVDLGRDRRLEDAILRQISCYPNVQIVPASDNESPSTRAPQPAEQGPDLSD